MTEEQTIVVKFNQDYCSRCLICYLICPFETVKREEGNARVEINIQKCQVCRICYSACPVFAIEILYYDYDSLASCVESELKRKQAETLVLMCRGNSPSTSEVEEILSEQGLSVKEYIPLTSTLFGTCSHRIHI